MWLHVPSIFSPSVPASEALNSASSLLLPSVAEALAASGTWRGKLQQPQAWSRLWKRGGFIRRLSGLTCSPLTAAHGADLWISSLRETRVKTTALPESERARTESGSSLPRLSGSLPSAGLILSSARTSRGTRTDSLRPSSQHWKDWATALRREFSARPKLAIPCAASDCSSWPSARAEDCESAGKRISRGVSDTLTAAARDWMAPRVERGGYTRDNGNPDMQRLTLEGQASQWDIGNWAAPTSNDSKRGSDSNRPNRRHEGPPLSEQAAQWRGPAARDFKGTNSVEHVTENSTGSMHLDQLPNFVEHCFHLPSSPDQPIAGGAMSSTDSPNSNQHSARRKLNPIFVEALMRWPTGLSGFERQETAWIRWQHVQLSFALALFSASSEQSQGDLFGGL